MADDRTRTDLRTFQLRVELFAGTDIKDATAELCELADRIGALITADFNGVKLWARPGNSPQRLAAAWEREMQRPPTCTASLKTARPTHDRPHPQAAHCRQPGG